MSKLNKIHVTDDSTRERSSLRATAMLVRGESRKKYSVSATHDLPLPSARSHEYQDEPLQHHSRNLLVHVLWQFERKVARPLRRRYHKFSWTTRETFGVMVSLCCRVYLLVSVPLRVGLFYDPFIAGSTSLWTPELIVLSTIDGFVDVVGMYEFVAFYRTWADSFSQLAESVSFEVGKKLSKKSHQGKRPKIITRNRASIVQRASQGRWTLAALAPSSTTSVHTHASHRRKRLTFVLEVVALIPVEILGFSTGKYNLVHVLRLAKLCRLYRIPSFISKLARIYSDRSWVMRLSFTGISKLVQNIAIGVVMCHWFACGYLLIGHLTCGLHLDLCNPGLETSWVIKDQLMGGSFFRQYGRALYWSSRSMVMLGYDDVTPVSNGETFYVLIVQVLGAILSSSLLATFLFIFRYRNLRQVAFNTHVDNAREYMKSQNLPRVVRRKVMSYFNYTWSTHHGLNGEEALLLLPKHLQSRVVYTLKASRIKQVCFLMKESIEFINLLALALVHRVYIPGDSIIEPKINAKMFFVIRGAVILSAFDGSSAKECQTGDFFADFCLLHPEEYEEKATAKTFCELYVLEKEKFDDAIHHFFRGSEEETRVRMNQVYDKYATQLRKTKKLLGMRGGESDTASGPARSNGVTGGTKSNIAWRFPGSTFRIRWDLLRLGAIIFVVFEVPYYVLFILNEEAQKSFREKPEFSHRFVVSIAVEAFFAADVILRARYFGYLDPVVMLNVVDPQMIFAAYKANDFYLDLVAVLPVSAILEILQGLSGTGLSFAWIFHVARLTRMRHISDLIQDLADHYSISSKAQLVISLVLGVAVSLHIVACMWFEMSWVPSLSNSAIENFAALDAVTRQKCLRMATIHGSCSWVRFDCYGQVGVVFPLMDKTTTYSSSFAYLRAMYWAVVALTGVGYGDIVAFSTAESYFAALWIFIGGIINFGVVGAMSSTISTLMASQHQHVEKLNTVNSIMEHIGISEKLRSEIRQFYRHQYTTRKKAYESELLMHLPDQLCYQISALLHSESTKRVVLFDSASREFLEEVTGKFRHRTYQNGETFYIEGDICKEFLVITHGKVNMFYQTKAVPIGVLHEGYCYGVNEFLLSRPHPVTLVAASSISASVMTRENFDVVLRKFEDEMKDIEEGAFESWSEDIVRWRRIAKNLESLKLKPHAIHSPSLFYQKDFSLRMSGGSIRILRDTEATRSMIEAGWNFLVTFWNMYNAFSIIFRISFHTQLTGMSVNTFKAMGFIDVVCDVCFAADIYLRMYYFGCEDAGIDNLLTREIVNAAYRKSTGFKWDLFASLPAYYLKYQSESDVYVSSLCRLPRLVRCFDLWAYLDGVIVQIQQIFASKNVSSYLSPLKLLFFLLLGSHFAACIFFWISESEYEQRPSYSWMSHDVILHRYHRSVPSLYLRSFYWALTTLSLTGSRDIVPRDVVGTIWATFTCLGCTFIMGYIIGELSELILNMDKEGKERKNRIDSFENFAKENQLSDGLRSRVALFFTVQARQTQGERINKEMKDLSANLRLKLTHEIYGFAINLLPISRYLTHTQTNNLALRLRSELFIPGDDILVEGTYGSRLCIVKQGLASVLWTDSVTTVAMLMENCLFGEVAFFLPKQRRIATVKAVASCEILQITKYDWDELWTGNGDATNTHVQKYALHSILSWVKYRLQCYQESTMTHAKRTHIVIQRKLKVNSANLLGVVKRGQTQRRLFLSGRSFASSENVGLEKKATYLLSKADKYMTEAANLRKHTVASAGMKRSSLGFDAQSIRHPSIHSEGNHSKSRRASLKIVDTHSRQFFRDLNPVTKALVNHVDDHDLALLETECWNRYRYTVALEHAVAGMMQKLVNVHQGHKNQGAAMSSSPVISGGGIYVPGNRRGSLAVNRISPLDEALSALKGTTMAHTDDDPQLLRRHRIFVSRILSLHTDNMPPAKADSSEFHLGASNCVDDSAFSTRREPCPTGGAASTNPGQSCKRGRLRRSNSLPDFEKTQYFVKAKEDYEHKHFTMNDPAGGVEIGMLGSSGINFEVLEKCRRPGFSALYRLYRKAMKWKVTGSSGETISLSGISMKSYRNLRNIPTAMSIKVDTSAKQAHGPNNTWKHGETPDKDGPSSHSGPEAKAAAFQILIKRVGKLWDLLILIISLYQAIVVPLKTAFVNDLRYSHGLEVWAAIEYVLDTLCIVDVIHRAHLAYHSKRGVSGQVSWLSSMYEGFYVDCVAVLPLEIFTSLLYASASSDFSVAWRSMTYLRLNKLIHAHRLQELSESIFQYMIYDMKLPISETALNFSRSLVAYLMLGHWIGCLWYAVGEAAYGIYSISWVSYTGMLIYTDLSSTSSSSQASTVYSSSSSSVSLQNASYVFDLHQISVARKYLRAMHFSIGSITTLFYGDVFSLNVLECFLEMLVILWSIYIYGSLIGAHGEVLEAHSRTKALFEQNLSELEHYLIHNDVPKALKKQVKQYYGNIWRRRQGEDEFSAISHISRILYEDIVFATLYRFAWKVSIFHALDVHFLRALLARLQYLVCSENEDIVIRGDVDRSMYFIAQGRVLVKQSKSESTKEVGDYFGELALLFGIPYSETCIALTSAELYRLDYSFYQEVLLDFPEHEARIKLEWTTAEQSPSAVSQLPIFGAPDSLITESGPTAAIESGFARSALLDEEVPRSFIFKSIMKMLSQAGQVEPLYAKEIIEHAKRGARKFLKSLARIETSRPHEEADSNENMDNLANRRRSKNTSFYEVHEFASDHPLALDINKLPRQSSLVDKVMLQQTTAVSPVRMLGSIGSPPESERKSDQV